MMSNNLTAYFAIGKPHLPPFVLAVRLAVLLPLLVILGRRLGVEGVAYAELIASVASLAVSYPVLFRTLKISSRSYLASLWRPLIASRSNGVCRARTAWRSGDGAESFRGDLATIDGNLLRSSRVLRGAVGPLGCIREAARRRGLSPGTRERARGST